MQYVKDTQRTALPHIRSVRLEQPDHAVIMDAATRRNLELTQNLAGGHDNTLSAVLDCTATPMGSRLLKRWIHQPIRDRVILKGRQSTIKELIEQNLYDELGSLLRQVGDVGAGAGAPGTALGPSARSHSPSAGLRPTA